MPGAPVKRWPAVARTVRNDARAVRKLTFLEPASNSANERLYQAFQHFLQMAQV
jgi:ABC-type dipeptide/oligopeptide/nickel transport system permease subunit